MNFKGILALFGVMLFGAGLVMAIGGATPSVVSESRWTNATGATDTTEGGNITVVNVVGSSLTDRWAAYWGNVSGGLILWDGVNTVYSWTPATASGEVCLSTGTSYTFDNAVGALATGVDTAWSFSGGADLATNTFVSPTNCTLDFTQRNVGTTIRANHTSGTFYTCAINDGINTTKPNFAFCTNVQNAGTAYNGATAQYEVMVPTDDSSSTATETFAFYLELN